MGPLSLSVENRISSYGYDTNEEDIYTIDNAGYNEFLNNASVFIKNSFTFMYFQSFEQDKLIMPKFMSTLNYLYIENSSMLKNILFDEKSNNAYAYLNVLYLSNNPCLSILSEPFSKFTNLTTLTINNCNFESLPDLEFKIFEKIDVSNNKNLKSISNIRARFSFTFVNNVNACLLKETKEKISNPQYITSYDALIYGNKDNFTLFRKRNWNYKSLNEYHSV